MKLNRKNNINFFLNRFFLFLFLIVAVVSDGCKVSYSFSGASISPEVKTFSVQYFQNRAPLVQPGLSQNLTDELIDKIKSQTNLKYVTSDGDVTFEGEITGYATRPQTVASNAQAATNRFTITLKVKFTNTVDPDLSFEQSFSRYADYDSMLNLSDVEDELSSDITEMIVEDVFNKAFVNW